MSQMTVVAETDRKEKEMEAAVAEMVRRNNMFSLFLNKRRRPGMTPTVTTELALAMWNFAIAAMNTKIEDVREDGLRAAIIKSRMEALKFLPAEIAKSLHSYLRGRYSHWGTDMTLEEFVVAMSTPRTAGCSFYNFEEAGPSVTPQKMRIASVHVTPERTAAVPKAPRRKKAKRYCVIHPDRKLPEQSKYGDIPACRGCIISLGKAIKGGRLKENSTPQEAIAFLKKNQK